MGYLVFWLLMAAVVAIVANSKGRNAFLWFLYGFLIWPIALVHIIVSKAAPPRLTVAEAAAAEEARRIAEEEARRYPCPNCAERIKPAARVWPRCQRDLPDGWAPASG